MASAKYAINAKDGRMVFATAEVAENPAYFVLHPETVDAIKNGKLKTDEVLKVIRSKSRTAEEVARLRPENVRETEFPKPDASITDQDGIKIPVLKVKGNPANKPEGSEGNGNPANKPEGDEGKGNPATLKPNGIEGDGAPAGSAEGDEGKGDPANKPEGDAVTSKPGKKGGKPKA